MADLIQMMLAAIEERRAMHRIRSAWITVQSSRMLSVSTDLSQM